MSKIIGGKQFKGPYKNTEGLANWGIWFNMAPRKDKPNIDSKPWLKMHEQYLEGKLSFIMV